MNKNRLLSLAIQVIPHPRDWNQIKIWCKGRSGVYAFINNTNGNCYIGSAVDLYNRLLDYHQPWYLEQRTNLPIVRAINKYGMDNFTLVVLEYTEPETTISSEQAWLDEYSPEYNVLTTASSTLGFKHTEESVEKIRESMTGKPRSADVRQAMSERQTGSGNTFYGKSHTDEAKALLRAAALARERDPKPGYNVTIVDKEDVNNPKFKKPLSMRKAAVALKCGRRSITNNDGKLYKGRYYIHINKDGPA
jgi:group I intron endonuclease